MLTFGSLAPKKAHPYAEPRLLMFFFAFLGRLLRVDLITLVRQWVRPSVRSYVRPQKVCPISMKLGM